MDSQLFNFYNLTGTEFSAAIILFNIVLSFALQLLIVWVYKRTHRGLSYSQSFLFTLVMIGVLGSIIMMVVQNNLIGAFALLGAFSLIRFRTIVKETRDVAFVFFALSTGVAVGTSNYVIAFIATFMLSLFILIMSRYGFGVGNTSTITGYVLTIETAEDVSRDLLTKIIDSHTAQYDSLHAKYRAGHGGHYAFSVNFKEDADLEKLSEGLKAIMGVKRVEFITSK
ncbi:MAG: DUF4956 domain-containing protein, partial [Candidatus Magasanikbacteria bacterium]|nr:DUF4956 domain-containing protein [Candidatus Magasanikbacteria bacterium]